MPSDQLRTRDVRVCLAGKSEGEVTKDVCDNESGRPPYGLLAVPYPNSVLCLCLGNQSPARIGLCLAVCDRESCSRVGLVSARILKSGMEQG
jgi:hypothetical protein